MSCLVHCTYMYIKFVLIDIVYCLLSIKCIRYMYVYVKKKYENLVLKKTIKPTLCVCYYDFYSIVLVH